MGFLLYQVTRIDGRNGIAIATWWLIFDGMNYMLLRVVFSYTKWALLKTSEISPG